MLVKISSIINALLLLLLVTTLKAQPFMVDEVVGVVGKNQILYSDIEDQYLQMQAQGVKPLPSKCQILEDILSQKLLVNQAEIDSIIVSDGEIDLELEQRINYFINQIGSEQKLIEYFGKSIIEIKEDMRDAIYDQVLVQRMRGDITADASITPAEVKQFYTSLPIDSIPIIEAEVEINQILIYPRSDENSVLVVREKLLNLRERIQNGENFATLAVLYSVCPSAPKGGDLGWSSKAELDPAFSKVAFSLKTGQVSKIVESSFGYHLIQLIERTDDRVHTRHILMQAQVSPDEKEKAKARLDSIITRVRIDTLTFEKAAIYYSQDEDTRMNGGLRVNPQTGTTKFALNQFETSEYYIIRNLKVGEISNSYESVDDKNKPVYKAVRIKSKTEPHKANLNQDFEVLKSMALQQKENEIVDKWLQEKIKSTYRLINEPYSGCNFRLKGWLEQ